MTPLAIAIELLKVLSITSDIRLFFEFQITNLLHVFSEFTLILRAKNWNRQRKFEISNSLIFFSFGTTSDALPRKGAVQEIQHHVAKGLQIISARQFDTNLAVYGGISRCTRWSSAIAIRNMLASASIDISFGEAKIDHIYLVNLLACAYQEILRFDIPVYDVLRVNVFKSL